MGELNVVGKSVLRIDALEKVTGKAVYCDDIKLHGMLHGKVLRSPHPHARIVDIDTSKAEKAPGVKCVLTGKDIPKRKYGVTVYDQYILARDVVRFVGEPVAAVAAESLDAAEEALKLIEVNFEPLPAIFDEEEAMSPIPPVILHPELSTYTQGMGEHRPDLDPERPNVHYHYKLRKGDINKGFQEAELVVEEKYSSAQIQHAALEPHCAVAKPEPDGGITIFAGKQCIHRTKVQISDVFEKAPFLVRIISPYVGGAFGSKITLAPSSFAALLAFETGRPVKVRYTREEVFIGSVTRGAMVVYIKDGVKKDGTLVAREMKIVINSGAYSEASGTCAYTAVCGAMACYRVPNIKVDSYAVYTNLPVSGALRGLHCHLTSMAAECQLNLIAEKLNLDPITIRKKNLLREGEENFSGEITHSIGAEKCLEKIADFIEWGRKSEKAQGPWRKGRGLAVANHFSIPTSSAAFVKVHENGAVEVRHSANEQGQGCNTVMAQIAAEEFGIPVESVKVIYTDTEITPYDYGSVSSRSTYATGNAVRLASQDAKRQICEAAAPKLGVSPSELEVGGGRVYIKGDSKKVIMVAGLFLPGGYLPKGGEIIGKATISQAYAPRDRETGVIDADLAKEGYRWMGFYTYGAHAVEVAVNVETGEVKVLKFVAVFDVGQPINVKMCEQQMEGGMGMGIGTSLMEEMVMERGRVLNPGFTDYRIPSIKEMPLIKDIKTEIVSGFHKDGPYGAKGLAEGAMMPTPPALAAAIYDATGVKLKSMPFTTEKVLQALKEKKR